MRREGQRRCDDLGAESGGRSILPAGDRVRRVGEVWASGYGRASMGERYGRAGMGERVWASGYGRASMGERVWASEYGRAGMGERVWAIGGASEAASELGRPGGQGVGSASTVTSREVAILRTSFAPSHAYRGAAARVLVRVPLLLSLPLINSENGRRTECRGRLGNHGQRRMRVTPAATG
jgi:hypothetical protein